MTENPKNKDIAARKARAALVSTFASFALTVAKLAAGLASGSLALVSEGAHNALDIGVSALTYFAVREADKPADEDHPFGHAKIEAVAALAQTGFLLALAIGVAVEAMRRLAEPQAAVDANALAFGAVLVSLIVDLVRWRALRKLAQETGSDALAADALHFSSDIVSSVLVLAGLIASRYGFARADALAAVGVAAFIGVAGFRLGARTLDALVDAAPKGLADEVRGVVGAAPGVAGIDFLRLRRIGPKVVGDLGLLVSRTLPLERVAAIKTGIGVALHARWPAMELTLTANPRALDDESVLERVRLIATRRRLFVHHVEIHHVDGRNCVTLDLEVDGRMTLGEAHETASLLEEAIEDEFGADIEVETHIEPMEIHEIAGRDAASDIKQRFVDALLRLAQPHPLLTDVHDIRLRATDEGYFGIFHCRARADATVAETHAAVDALEREVKQALPEIVRIVGHAEPAR